MNANEIQWLQVENTTRCNAWCPECARNQGGFDLKPGLIVQDLDTQRFAEILQTFPNLQTIQFCGTYGDAIAANNVIEHIELARRHSKKIQIHTHGGLRNTQWWKEFADLLKGHDHDVWFAIDGLAGVHELYRQGTSFEKVIENAQQFIQAGGYATWQFIPWKHNEHQITQCIKTSQELGFKKFKLVTAVRSSVQPRHYRTGEAIVLENWSRAQQTNSLLQPRTRVEHSSCFHLREKSVYVNANGSLSHCCYFNVFRSYNQFDQLNDMQTELDTKPHHSCVKWCGST